MTRARRDPPRPAPEASREERRLLAKLEHAWGTAPSGREPGATFVARVNRERQGREGAK